MNDLISIIMPVHNNRNYLQACLDSIRGQSYRPIECVLVDDGSDEDYVDFYDSFNDDVITVYHIKKAGVSGARNYGLEKSSGDYICFVDSDDIVAKDYCRRLYDLIHNYGTDISACSYLHFSNELPEIKSGGGYREITVEGAECWWNILNSDCSAEGYLWNKLYKRETLLGLRFDESLSMSEDMLFVFQAVEHVDVLAVTDEPLYFYRRNTDSATWYFNMTAEKCKQGIDVAKRVADIVGDRDQKNYEGYKDYIAKNIYRYCAYLAERKPAGWKSEMEMNRSEYLKNYDSARVEKSQGEEHEFVTNYKKWLTDRFIFRKKMQTKRLLKKF